MGSVSECKTCRLVVMGIKWGQEVCLPPLSLLLAAHFGKLFFIEEGIVLLKELAELIEEELLVTMCRAALADDSNYLLVVFLTEIWHLVLLP